MNTTLSNLSAGEYTRLFEARGAAAYRVTIPSDGLVALHWSPGGKIRGLKLSGSLDPMALSTFFGSFYLKWLSTVCKAVTEQTEYTFMHMIQTAQGPVAVRHCVCGSSPECAVGLVMEEAGSTSPAIPQERPMLLSDTPNSLGAMENIPMGVYYIDKDFRVLWANEAAAQLNDYNWREKYGQLCYEQLSGESVPCEDCPVARTLEDGRLHVSEKVMPGGEIWNLISIPAFDAGGRQLGAIEVVSDVTAQVREHKQAAELLKRQRERLKAQIEVIKYLQAHYAMDDVDFMTSPEAVTEAVVHTLESSEARFWIRDKSGFRCIDCYDPIEGVHKKNVSAPEHVLNFFWEQSSPKGFVPIADVLDADLPSGIAEYYLSQGLRAVLFSPIKIKANLLGFITIVHSAPHAWMPEEQSFAMAIADFVALSLNQRSLDDHRRRVHALLANLPGAAFRMRYSVQEAVVEFLSEGSVTLTGWPVHDVLGRPDILKEMIFEDDYDAYHKLHLQRHGINDTVESFFRFKTPDGTVRWALERCRVIDADESVGAIVYEGFTHDITEQIRLKEAELVNESKSNFLAAMSHELRTPLNAILGFSRKIEASVLPVEQRQNLGKMQAAAKVLLELVNGILDFSSIEAGNFELRDEEFTLSDVLQGLEAIFSDVAERKGIDFHASADASIPDALVGDPVSISQVLINLVANATKFTERGSVVVMCDVAASSGNERMLRFTVADTGMGIAPEQQEAIFSPFVQADASASRKHGGVGLGLSIARSLVERMGGSITVQSEVGRGTLFTFTCKVRSRDLGIREANEVLALPQFRGQRVLLVEDNAINREIALSLLEEANLQVVAAENGKDALDILLGKNAYASFDLVLMDVQMPVMDGLEATRILRANKETASLPIVAMTAHCLDSEKKRCHAAGMDEHIGKPIDVWQLYTTLARFLKGETEH